MGGQIWYVLLHLDRGGTGNSPLRNLPIRVSGFVSTAAFEWQQDSVASRGATPQKTKNDAGGPEGPVE